MTKALEMTILRYIPLTHIRLHAKLCKENINQPSFSTSVLWPLYWAVGDCSPLPLLAHGDWIKTMMSLEKSLDTIQHSSVVLVRLFSAAWQMPTWYATPLDIFMQALSSASVKRLNDSQLTLSPMINDLRQCDPSWFSKGQISLSARCQY